MDASEDSQLRAAIAASLACTTSTKQTELSSDEDDDFDDLEFSESDSGGENTSPQKNVSKPSTSVKADVKREINFNESPDKTQETCIKGSKAPKSEHLNSNDSVKNRNRSAPAAKINNETSRKSEARIGEVDSKVEDNVDSSNQRTQEQAGEW